MSRPTRPWWHDAQFYHIYPLGYCGAPRENPAPGTDHAGAAPEERLTAVREALPDLADHGYNALYLGPLFEASSHGYDTADYFAVDRRLGTNDTLTRLVARAHELDIRVVLDGVFNHVGRDFWAFRDLRKRGAESPYADWFRGVDFSRNNGFGDGFVYEGWEGTDTLVALNLDKREVREHLFDAVRTMVGTFGVDGLRLDVAYLLPLDFLEQLRRTTDEAAAARPADEGSRDFWLMGEMIHGDYAALTAPGRLHSVTNYECYKGLWSSHNDRNYFEIAHSLERLFGAGGVLTVDGDRGGDRRAEPVPTYNFADNHDVDRVVSSLSDPDHIFPLYALLWTVPGLPSVYYGSEWMIHGRKSEGDAALRPAWPDIPKDDDRLIRFLDELSRIRKEQPALRYGTYRQVHVANETFAFAREHDGATVLVAVNAGDEPCTIQLEDQKDADGSYIDLFAGTTQSPGTGIPVPAKGSAVLRRTD